MGLVWVGLVYRIRFRWQPWMVLVTLAWAPVRAFGGSFELFGVHPEGLAEASARTAEAHDGSACFYNPGGLGMGKGYDLELSGVGVASVLEAQGERKRIEDPVGGTFTLSADVPLEGPLEDRIRVGLALHFLPDHLMRLSTKPQAMPFFPYYDNRSQRFVFMPALSVRLARSLSVGFAVNALAGVEGPVDVREGQSRTLETRLVQEAGTVARWIAGVRFDPSPDLHLGAVYRQSFGVPLSVATEADVAGVPLTVDVSKAEALFDPATVVVAGRLRASDRLAFEVDATYQRWSSWEGPLLGVDTTVSALSLVSKPPSGLFQDTFGVRSAASFRWMRRRGEQLRLHLGGGFETSMIDASQRQGRSNYVDGPKAIVGAGVSGRFPGAVGEALRVGLGVQVHHVARFEQDKVVCTQVPCPRPTVVGPDANAPSEGIENPGYPTLSGGGSVMALSVGLGVEW